MALLRHILAAGGWLANMANQTMLIDNWTRDRVRPGRLLLWCGLLCFLAATPLVERTDNPERALVTGAELVALAAFMLLGWVSGLVPFVRDRDDSAQLNGAGNSGSGTSVPVHVTGVVVDTAGTKRRFRNRPAQLRINEAALGLIVGGWVAAYSSKPTAKLPSAYVTLPWQEASDLERGTAFLTTTELPAVRLTTPQGGLILTFETASARDEAFAAMASRRPGTDETHRA